MNGRRQVNTAGNSPQLVTFLSCQDNIGVGGNKPLGHCRGLQRKLCLTFHVASLVLISSIIAGCATVIGVQAIGTAPYASMAIKGALDAKPDQKLSYTIEVATVDGDSIIFNGSTNCRHSVSFHSDAGYTTTKSYVESYFGSQRWILAGINCDNEIKKGESTKYILYKTINAETAKVYFVEEGGGAKVTTSLFEHSIHTSANERPEYFDDYDDGPYIYQKVFFDEQLTLFSDKTAPLVICLTPMGCGNKYEVVVNIDSDEFSNEVFRKRRVVAIEEGYLEYVRDTKVWLPKPDRSHTTSFDVAAKRISGPNSTGSAQDLGHWYMRIQYDGGQPHTVSTNNRSRLLYVPAERALFLVGRLYRADQDQKVWHSCPKPQDVPVFSPGTMHITGTGRFGPFVKQNQDGSFSCQNSFIWLNPNWGK